MNDREASIFGPKPRRININNSLSTLDPVHYEVMNTPTRPGTSDVRGGRVLDMRHVILWQQEQAQLRGELGLTMNFPDPSEIFIPFNTDADSNTPADDRATLVAAMQETHKSFVQLYQRKVLMDHAGPLLASTEMNVSQKLIAAGIPEHDFQHKSLNQKIVQLVELEDPPPKENFVVVLIEVASSTKGRSHILEVNLPLKACMAEVYALLDEVVKALLAEKGLSYERGGAWKYQLIDQSRSQLVLGKSSPLETDLHYKVMLQQASKVGDARAPLPVLTQGGVAKAMTMSGPNEEDQGGLDAKGGTLSNAFEGLDEDDNVLEVLDDDGNPFFEPLDMDRMIKKYADLGDDLTEESGVHGFWR